MRIYNKSTLRAYWEKHTETVTQLQTWYRKTEQATWKNPSDIKAVYSDASILPDNRVVFNINGNKYRLIVKVHYDRQKVYIRFIGTHSEYDKVDATTI